MDFIKYVIDSLFLMSDSCVGHGYHGTYKNLLTATLALFGFVGLFNLCFFSLKKHFKPWLTTLLAWVISIFISIVLLLIIGSIMEIFN